MTVILKDLLKFVKNSWNKTEFILSECILKGIPSSPGLAFGEAVVIIPETFIFQHDKISRDKTREQITLFEQAIGQASEEMQAAFGKVKKKAPNVAAVLETHLLLLRDNYFAESVKERISDGFTAESSVIMELDSQKQYLSLSKDSIIRERAIELDHIKERIIAALRNRNIQYKVPANSIVVAQSISPADLVGLKESKIAGLLTEAGGISSHTMILARTFEIPAVIGIKDATRLVEDNSSLILDGYSGTVIIYPRKKSIAAYNEKKARESKNKKKLGILLKLSSETSDGRKVSLLANVNFPEDVETAAMAGADGIGLVRSEHLIISLGHFPGEDEQFNWYNEIAQRAYPKPVTLRAFDVGSDKFAEGIPHHENNPALGFRGIRFLLQRTDIFRLQIRAALRASHFKNVRFMLPMITTLDEVERSLNLINECKKELDGESIPFDRKIPVGIMIETPAAALIADTLAEQAAFFSIGTNDLTQYTLAADRTNELLSDSFDAFHPAVLRLIKISVDAAKKRGIPVDVCGEIAGHTAATPILIGFGVEGLSISPSILLEIKKHIREMKYEQSQKLAKDILKCKSYREIRKKLFLV